jgi:cell division protein FtsW
MAGRISFRGIAKYWVVSIDRVVLFAIISIISIGVWISIASTPSVAIKIGLAPFHFVKQHLIMTPIALLLILVVSCLQTRNLRLLAIIGYFCCVFLVVLTLFIGTEIKGAKRWLSLAAFSLQPSEFLKPSIGVLTAWLIAEQYRDREFPGIALSCASMLMVIPLLLAQPDVGMSFVLSMTWIGQLFISGLSLFTIGAFIIAAIGASVGLYFSLPHFAERIDKFFVKGDIGTDLYQVQKSLEAFKSGGLFGKGPGEGIVKTLVPDAHSDFVFSVIGEEFGFVLCIAIIILFVIILVRPLTKIINSSSIFVFSAVFGVVFQMAMQILINLATALNLIPTKGMTLPFISYGGSSFLSSAISVGILLALTKKNSLNREVL